MSPEAVERLDEIFRTTFNLNAARDLASANQESVKLWDSMGLMSLIMAIESEFGLTIDMNDVETMTSYKAVRKFLEDKVA